jgi:hypothetical protein
MLQPAAAACCTKKKTDIIERRNQVAVLQQCCLAEPGLHTSVLLLHGGGTVILGCHNPLIALVSSHALPLPAAKFRNRRHNALCSSPPAVKVIQMSLNQPRTVAAPHLSQLLAGVEVCRLVPY